MKLQNERQENNNKLAFLPMHSSRSQEGRRPIFDEICTMKDEITELLNKLTKKCILDKKWFGIVGKDGELTFGLKGLSSSTITFLISYFHSEDLITKELGAPGMQLSGDQLEHEFFSEERQAYFDKLSNKFLGKKNYDDFIDLLWDIIIRSKTREAVHNLTLVCIISKIDRERIILPHDDNDINKGMFINALFISFCQGEALSYFREFLVEKLKCEKTLERFTTPSSCQYGFSAAYYLLLSALISLRPDEDLQQSRFNWAVEMLLSFDVNVAELMKSLVAEDFEKKEIYKNLEGLNLIAFAIEYDYVEIVRYCLNKKLLSVDEPIQFNKRNLTLLQYAALKGTARMIDLLVKEFKADPVKVIPEGCVYVGKPTIYLTVEYPTKSAAESLVNALGAYMGESWRQEEGDDFFASYAERLDNNFKNDKTCLNKMFNRFKSFAETIHVNYCTLDTKCDPYVVELEGSGSYPMNYYHIFLENILKIHLHESKKGTKVSFDLSRKNSWGLSKEMLTDDMADYFINLVNVVESFRQGFISLNLNRFVFLLFVDVEHISMRFIFSEKPKNYRESNFNKFIGTLQKIYPGLNFIKDTSSEGDNSIRFTCSISANKASSLLGSDALFKLSTEMQGSGFQMLAKDSLDNAKLSCAAQSNKENGGGSGNNSGMKKKTQKRKQKSNKQRLGRSLKDPTKSKETQKSTLVNEDEKAKPIAINKAKAFLLKVIRVVIHVDNWEVCDEGFYAIPKARNNYDIRLHNAQIMLACVWKMCGFSDNDKRVEIKNIDGGDRFIVTKTLLQHESLVKNICDKKFVGEAQKMANQLINVTRKLKDISDLENTVEKLEKEYIDKLNKQDDEWEKQRKYSLQRPKKPKVKSKKENKKLKKKQVGVPAGQPVKTKKNDDKKPKNKIPAQPQRDYELKNLGTDNTRFFNALGGDYFDYSHPKMKVAAADKGDLPEKMDAVVLDEHTVLGQLEQLIDKLAALIKTQASDKHHQSVYVAGWHYLHAQLCNLLTHLPDKHSAKEYIFTPHGYSGTTFYDQQKHVYFPGCKLESENTGYYFKDVSAIQAQISYIFSGHLPIQETAKEANNVVRAWSSYLEHEFNNEQNSLEKIITSFETLEEFGKWLDKNIESYTAHLRELINDYDAEQSAAEKQALEYAIRFYVTRVGELAGHLPYNKRGGFLRYCRRFRNAVSHTYEDNSDDENINNNNKEERDFKVDALKKALPSNRNISFLASMNASSDEERFECFVSETYRYSLETIALLTETKTSALEKKIPIVVSQPVTFKANTNLFAMLKTSRDKLDGESGLMLIPAKIESAEGKSVPVAISLQFSDGNLTEVAYSEVTNSSHVKSCMDVLGRNWCEASGQKGSLKKVKEVLPQIKTDNIDDYGVMHVELLGHLAERKVNDGKTSGMPKQMKEVRNEHIRAMWKAGDQEYYLSQMLKRRVKPIVQVTSRGPSRGRAVFYDSSAVFGHLKK